MGMTENPEKKLLDKTAQISAPKGHEPQHIAKSSRHQVLQPFDTNADSTKCGDVCCQQLYSVLSYRWDVYRWQGDVCLRFCDYIKLVCMHYR